MSELDRVDDRIVQLLRSKSGASNSQWSGASESKRPPRLQVNADDGTETQSIDMVVVSREVSASIKAGIDSEGHGVEIVDQPDSVGPVVSQSSLTARLSEDLSLRELNSLNSPNSRTTLSRPTPVSNLGIVTTTEKYGTSVPSSPQRSPRRTPRGSSRHGSGSSGRSLTARSVGALGNGKPPTPRGRTTPIRELDRMAIEAKAPPRFICPISGRVMRDPVILMTGTTCDRVALERRLAAGNKRCPVTSKNLRVPISMTPNTELRDSISVWARKNAPWMMDPTGVFLLSEETGRYELQGSDNQYVSTPGAFTPKASRTPSRTPSRTESGKGSWVYTNGAKARPGAVNGSFNMSATPGTLEAGRGGSIPWYASRGIASPRSSRQMSGRRSSRGTSGSPTKSRKPAGPGDWFSLIFLIVMSAVYLGMFLFALSLNDWKIAPMSENPWYGPSAEALIDAGAIVLPLMNAPGNQWWRLFSSVFLPAGMIQMFVCSALLWMFGYPARKSLPLPQASVAGVFIVSSLVGSLTSSNLNGKYVSCGAFSGVMSLIAVFCVDQMLSWPRNRLFNLKEWWLIAMVMVSLVGGILVISLFPLVDIWFSLGGFISGMLIAFILVIMPRVRSQAFGSRKKLLWIQALSGVALLGLIIAASVGLAITPKLGESIEVLSQISCVQMSSDMECTPYGFLSKGGCGLQWVHESSAVAVACPAVSADSSGYQYFPTNATFADIGNDAITETECQRYCDGRSDPINIIAVPPASTVTADEVVDELNQNAEGSADAESVAAQASLLAPALAPSTPAPVNVDPLTTIAQPVATQPVATQPVATQPVATQPVATQPTNDPQQVSAMNQPLMGTGAADGAATQSAPLDPAVTIPSPISNPLPSPTSTNAGGLNPWGRGSTTTTPATSSTTTPTSIPAPANAGPVDIGISNQALGAVDTPQSPTTTFQSPTTFPAPPAPLFG